MANCRSDRLNESRGDCFDRFESLTEPCHGLALARQFAVWQKGGDRLVVPLVLFLIFMLLYMTFHSASEATIVMSSVVYAMIGGVILQWLLGYNFSVTV